MTHLAVKVLSRGKLNKSNQWDGHHDPGGVNPELSTAQKGLPDESQC
jgi:hypothetical protein